MGHRLPGIESQVSLVRRQIDAVGRMDLDLLESLLGERLAARREQANRPAPEERPGRAAAPPGTTAEDLRQLEQLLADQLDERIRACARTLYQLTGSRGAGTVVSAAHRGLIPVRRASELDGGRHGHASHRRKGPHGQ